MPLIISSSPTVSESDSGHTEGIPIIITFSTLFLIIVLFVLIGIMLKRRSRRRLHPSPLNRNKSMTPRHQRTIINATRTAISRLRAKSIRKPEAAHILNEILADVSAPHPPLSSSMLPVVHIAGENASIAPESSPPKYKRHAFRERLPDYEPLDLREPRRETRQSRHSHRIARRSREDRHMRSVLLDPYGIDWLVAPSNDEEDGIEGRFSVSAIAPP
ncbi:hypothetical protein MMC17_003294 [Xylographa soralifera]|nr:hypothetical protein [Xylographa soralifera]